MLEYYQLPLIWSIGLSQRVRFDLKNPQPTLLQLRHACPNYRRIDTMNFSV